MRGAIVFAATLAMVRMSSKRSLAEKTAFDAVLIVMIASILARAINGSASFFPTIGVGFVLVLLHRIMGAVACHSHFLGNLIKGEPEIIVRNGVLLQDIMRRNHVSIHDLEEDMRLTAKIEDLSKIKSACVERSGEISFIKIE